MSLQIINFYLKRYFAWYLTEVGLNNKGGYTDINKFAESILLPVFEAIYHNEFKRLEYEEQNFPGVDIACKKQGLAFQITSEVSADKIRHTLGRVIDRQISLEYPHCKILFLDADYKSQLSQSQINDFLRSRNADPTFRFDLKEDCWNITRLLAEIEANVHPKGLDRIINLLDHEFLEHSALLSPWDASAYQLPKSASTDRSADFFSIFEAEYPQVDLTFKHFAAELPRLLGKNVPVPAMRPVAELERVIILAYYEAVFQFNRRQPETDSAFLAATYFFRSPAFVSALLEMNFLQTSPDQIALLHALAQSGYTAQLNAGQMNNFTVDFGKALDSYDKLQLLRLPRRSALQLFQPGAELADAASSILADEDFYRSMAVKSSASAALEANFIERTLWSRKREAIYLEDVYIPRKIEDDITARIDNSKGKHQLLFVAGDAGHGKTSLLWQLNRHYNGVTGFYPLFIKSIQVLQTDYSKLLYLLRHRLGLQPLLFLDTIDLLLHGEADRQKLLDLIAQLENTGTICLATSRPQELASLAYLRATYGEHYGLFQLGNYDDEELSEAIERYAGVYYEKVPSDELYSTVERIRLEATANRSLRPVYINPLTNRMLFTLYAPYNLPPSINVFRLYEQFWERRVSHDIRAGSDGVPTQQEAKRDLSIPACVIALTMLATGKVTLPKTMLTGYAEKHPLDVDDIRLLIDRGILKPDPLEEQVEFFHQTFFEHAAAKAMIKFAEWEAITLLWNRAFAVHDVISDTLFFISPILEHTLLLAENTRYLRQSLETTAELLTSGVAEKVQIGTYVYALYQQQHSQLHDTMAQQLSAYTGDDSIYIKRLIFNAVNMDDRRLTHLFSLLKIIWVRGIWNERFNLIELLEFLVLKEPAEVRRFLDENEVLAASVGYYQRTNKREHQESFKNLIRIFFRLLSSDPVYAQKNLLAAAKINDMPVSRMILSDGKQIPTLQADKDFWLELLDILLQAATEKTRRKRAGRAEAINMLSAVRAQTLLYDSQERIRIIEELVVRKDPVWTEVTLMAIGNICHTLSKEDANAIFHFFKSQINEPDIFTWTRNILPFSGQAQEQACELEKLFIADIRALLTRGLKETISGKEIVLLRAYPDMLNGFDPSSPLYLFKAFEDFYLDRRYLAVYPSLARPLLFAYLNDYSDTSSLTEPLDTAFFGENLKVCEKMTATITTRNIYNEKLFHFFMDICLLHHAVKVIIYYMEQICSGLFVNPGDVPGYLYPFKNELSQLAEQGILSANVIERAESSHLLHMLVKTGLAPKPSYQQLKTWFEHDKRDTVLSWVVELYGFCQPANEQETHDLLVLLRHHFQHPMPKIREKARCAFLYQVLHSRFDLGNLKNELLEIYADSPEMDNTSSRIKIINRIIMSYAAKKLPLGFELLYGLLSSPELIEYPATKQNETQHELHNGCIHVCMHMELPYLEKLTELLRTTSPQYGRLILDGISFDKFKFAELSAQLNIIKNDPAMQVFNKHQLANLMQYKLKPAGNKEWNELLSFI